MGTLTRDIKNCKQFTIRLKPESHALLAHISKQQKRSRSLIIQDLVESMRKRFEKKY